MGDNVIPDDEERRALIVVDVQRDLCEGGAAALRGGNDVAAAIALLAQEAEYEAVVATRDWHVDPGAHFAAPGTPPDFETSWPPHCVADTEGARLHTTIEELEFDAVFDKGHHGGAASGFESIEHHTGEPLEGWLERHRITAIDVVGMPAELCVAATALDGVRHGYATRVLRGAIAGLAPETTAAAIGRMKAGGVQLAPGLGDLV
jgi:nicotinamidase/pyrazinamidase